MAKDAGRVVLRGRFSPGTRVRLVRVAGAHVLRPGETDEEVDNAVVDEDGCVSFGRGVVVGDRYFVSGIQQGSPLDVRCIGRASDDPGPFENFSPILPDRVKLADGTFVDEPPEQHQDTNLPDGATWPGQHQVPKGTIQRSDTPRGSAAPISAEELERARRGHRRQEPTEPIVEAAVEESMDPGSAPARTSERPAAAKRKPATARKRPARSKKAAAKPADESTTAKEK